MDPYVQFNALGKAKSTKVAHGMGKEPTWTDVRYFSYLGYFLFIKGQGMGLEATDQCL